MTVSLSATVASGLLYPGGTVLDASTRGYSFTHNFLSDLGSTVAFNDGRNTAGALLFALALVVGVAVLAGSFVAPVRLLSATSPGRGFARLAAVVGALVCVGFLGAALTPIDRAFRLHAGSTLLACYSFPVAAALLAVATWRDGRFAAGAPLGWLTLTIVLTGFAIIGHLGPSADTEFGLMTQVISQKIMALTALVVLWIEGSEAERIARTLRHEEFAA